MFNMAAARKAVEFFHNDLCHVKGAKAGTPFYLERWQQAIIGNLFGWIRSDGTRRYREAFIFVPRKNGKTPMAAGIILLGLFEDGEPCAEVYGAASEFGQASKVFEHARGMVLRNPRLRDRAKICSGQSDRSIQLTEDFSTYAVVSSKPGSRHGDNTHLYVIDEVHTLPDSELIEVFETSTAARRQPLGVLITTSDYERPGSPCNAKYDYACKVRDGSRDPSKGIQDPAFLPVIYEAARDADWTKESTWKIANPNLGVSVSLDHIRAACKRAQESPASENTFRRLHLNQRTEQAVRWLPMDKWDLCAGEPLNLEDYAGRPCWAGLDLATTRDLTALVLAFPNDDGVIDLLPIFWIPEVTAAERAKRDNRIQYLEWIREGYIRETPGAETDYDIVRRDINALEEMGIQIEQIAADRKFQGAQLVHQLSSDGFETLAFGQGFYDMPAPTKRFEELVLSGKLRHGGNPVLRWHASNASVALDEAGNMKPDRKRSSEKIDGIVAAIMAIRGIMVREEKKPSVYETRGIITLGG